jgi:O-antigen/teichoic acid export membrane protein
MTISAGAADLGRIFRRGFAATFALDLVTKAISAVTVVLLIRGLSVSSYAYVTLILTLAQFAGSAAGGGVRTQYLRREAERLSRGIADDHDLAFSRALRKGAVLVVAIGIVAFPIVFITHLGSDFASAWSFIAYATSFALGIAATELAIARYQAKRRFAAAGVVNVARAAGLLCAAVMILITDVGVVGVSIWLASSMVLVGLATAGPIALRPLLELRRQSHTGGLPRFTSEETWLSIYYLAAAGFAYVDVMVAGALLTQHQLATLGASLRYLAIVQSPIPALGAVLRVRTAQIDLIDSAINQRAMVTSWLKRSLVPVGLVVLGVVLLAPVLIPHIDGGKYPGSIGALQIFLVTAVTAYLTAPAVSILMAQQRYLFLASSYVVALVLNFIGDVLVARRFGVIGIAIVSSSVYVAMDGVLTSYALHYARRVNSLMGEGVESPRWQTPSARDSALEEGRESDA